MFGQVILGVWFQISEFELLRVWRWRLGTVHSGEVVSTTAVIHITGIL